MTSQIEAPYDSRGQADRGLSSTAACLLISLAMASCSVGRADPAVPRSPLAEPPTPAASGPVMVHMASRLAQAKALKGPSEGWWYGLSSLLRQAIDILAIPIRGTDYSVDVSHYPNTWLIVDRGVSTCIATTIGERSVLTAAHCVDTSKSYTLVQANREMPASCRRMDRTPGLTDPQTCKAGQDRGQDLAICTLTKEGDKFDSTGGFETVARPPQAGGSTPSLVVVTWAGCRGGLSPKEKLLPVPLSQPTWPPTSEPNGVVMGSTDRAKFCGGDSGGPWMALPAGSARSLVAVHVCREGMSTSWGVSLRSPEVEDFLKLQDKNAALCGYSEKRLGLCR